MGTPEMLWSLAHILAWQRELEARPGLLLALGSWEMPNLVYSESKLLEELGVLFHVSQAVP